MKEQQTLVINVNLTRGLVALLTMVLGLSLSLLFIGLPGSVDAQGPDDGIGPQAAGGTGFTYQGKLMQGTTAISGTCNLTFKLYGSESGTDQIGPDVTKSSVSVSDGYLSEKLDFGRNAFTGEPRWLEITINSCNGSGSPVTLSPRQELTPVPYAQTIYRRTVVVSPVGSKTENGTALLNALAGINGTATTPYLLKIEPGEYDLGSNPLTMKDFVDIEGSGENITIITAQVGSGSANTGAVKGANNAELRFLRVVNDGNSSDYSIGIYNNSAWLRLIHVTVYVDGGATGNYGVYNHFSSLDMTNVDITASAMSPANSYGVYNYESTYLTMLNVTIIALGGGNSYGMYNDASSPTIRHSIVEGGSGINNYGIYNTSAFGAHTVTVNHSQIRGSTNTINNGSNYTTNVGASQLDGGAVVNAGVALTCYGVYDENYTNTISVNSCP